MKNYRKSRVIRKTKETDISIALDLDGTGKSRIKKPLGFLSHMLTLFAKHGLFDLKVSAKGDTDVDIHHTNEDIGICLGSAFSKAWGSKSGIGRFGFASVPMDEALAEVSVDLSGRPYLKLQLPGLARPYNFKTEYNFNTLKHFLQAFVMSAGVTMHIDILCGDDPHHIIEAVFKASGRAMRQACAIDRRVKGIMSTKGVL